MQKEATDKEVTIPDSATQFFRFAIVGVLNTAVDFAVLNFLIVLVGLGVAGERYVVFKVISFIVAVLHSYAWNKYWVFRAKGEKVKAVTSKESGSFLIVSSVGLLLNALISYFVFSLGASVFPEVGRLAWANVGALAGVVVVLMWNFFGYKFFVFKK
jgi:putative flippase GtrA